MHVIFVPAAAMNLLRVDPTANDGAETIGASERGDVLAYGRALSTRPETRGAP